MRLRRQRVFVLLAVIPPTALLAGLFGGMWIAAQLLVDIGLIGYVAHLRHAALADRRLHVARRALDRRIAAERAVHYGVRADGRDAVGGSDHGWASGTEPFRLAEPAIHTDGAAAMDAGADGGAVVDGAVVAGHSSGAVVPDDAASGSRGAAAAVGGTGVDAGLEADLETSGVLEGVVESSTGSAALVGAGYAGSDSDPAGSEGSEADFPEGDEVPGQVAASASGRPVARPPARPNTSKPGRVQVNPPGTHGGLTAGPEGAPPQAAATEDPEEVDELLRRRAVGS